VAEAKAFVSHHGTVEVEVVATTVLLRLWQFFDNHVGILWARPAERRNHLARGVFDLAHVI
jgi:hypothetical protein